MPALQIYDRRERALVRAADLAIRPLTWFGRMARADHPVRRVLLLRLERIGDFLMTLDAIRDAREIWPHATLDLAVGSWNAPLARLVPDVNEVLTADVGWLAREGKGQSARTLFAMARAWRRRGYDVVVNFEPDIRTNALAWLVGSPWRFGYWTGGGRAFLTHAEAYEPAIHVADNARRLIGVAGAATNARRAPGTPPRGAVMTLSAHETGRVTRLLAECRRPLIGVHVAGGRLSKQWHMARFADVARVLAAERGATIVLTGSEADRPLVEEVTRALGDVKPVNACGVLALPDLAGLIARLDLLITSDTGPMHLADAVGTPLVALFGPSDPRRYGPRSRGARVLRVDLPCSPCGQVRRPPERCRGHVPDCMDGISVAAVLDAARAALDEGAGAGPRA